MLSAGQGREGALAAALLNDPNLMEKSWLDTGMFAEAALHAHVSTRMLFQKEVLIILGTVTGSLNHISNTHIIIRLILIAT